MSNKKEIHWIWKNLIIVVLFGIILYIILYLWVIPKLNPIPEINLDCYPDGKGEIEFILDNPSRKSPAENYNLIIKSRYNGGGSSHPDNELCSVGDYLNLEYTVIHCDYIAPNTNVTLNIRFKNESLRKFEYSSWGKTTPKKTNEWINCE